MLLDNIDNSKLFAEVETRTMISMMRNIASSIDLERASSIAEEVGLPDINYLEKDDGETENVQVFDFDLYIDQFKEENNIEINPDDIGTDISDIDSLHDWLYNNGVTRESVQNDRDSGCKNPYLDGYLEYLDNLDKPSETPSKSLDDYEVSEDGEIIVDDWSERFGSSSDMQNGFDGIEDIGDEVRQSVESGEAQKYVDEWLANHPGLKP